MKRKTHSKRRKSGLSAPGRKRRTHRKSKGILGDLLNPTMAKNSAMTTLTSVLGGYGAIVVNKTVIPEKWGKPGKIISGLIGGFLLTNFGMPTLGSSLTGGMTALAFKDGLLNDDSEFADNDILSAPQFLDEKGNEMFLDEDSGEFYYPMTEENFSPIYQY